MPQGGRFGVFLLMLSLAVVIYGYHAWQEAVFKNPEQQPTGRTKTERNGTRGDYTDYFMITSDGQPVAGICQRAGSLADLLTTRNSHPNDLDVINFFLLK